MTRPSRRHLLLGLAFAISCAASIASTTPAKAQSVRVADLPRWEGEAHTLRWLNPRAFRTSAEGRAPDVRFGAKRFPTVLHAYALAPAARPGRPVPLVDGWEVEASTSGGCLKGELNLRHRPSGRRARWTQSTPSLFTEQQVNCIGPTLPAHHAVVINSRHLAFLTTENNWIFFDRQQGRFLQLVVLANPDRHSNLYVTPEGRALIEVDLSYDPATHAAAADPSAEGIREIVLNGKPLQAPLRPRDSDAVHAANHTVQCWLATDLGESCEDH